MNGGPKARWHKAMISLAEARQYGALIADADSTIEQDRATTSYVTAVNSLVVELGALEDRGQLAGVASFLEAVFGRAN